MNEPRAVILQVDAFTGCIGRQENTDIAVARISLEGCLDPFPFLGVHAAVHR